MKRPLPPLCALALLALTARSDAEVVIVDANGAGDHVDIQSAIDGALDGDTILLRRPPVQSRRFRGFVVDGKSLVIQGDTIEPVRTGPVVVRNLGPQQQVKLVHLRVNPQGYPPPPDATAVALELEANEGVVWVHGCEILGSSPQGREGVLAARICSSSTTILSDSLVEGGAGDESAYSGVGLDSGAGLRARGSFVWLYGSEVAGGKGGFGGYFDGGRGGDGIALVASELYAADSLIRGGDGGDSLGVGSDGGDGLIVPASSNAVLFDTELLGGLPAIFSDGTEGLALVGVVTPVPGSAPVLETPRSAAAGDTVTLRFLGEPGDSVVLLVSGRVTAQPLGATSGTLHTGSPFERVQVGSIPGSGELTLPFVAPPAPTGGARTLVLQAVFVRPGTGALASGPELMSSLDGQFVPECGGRIHVDDDAPPGGDGESWATAYRSLRVALGAVPECPGSATEVWVAEGIYKPDAPGGDRGRTFYVYSDTHLYGGFEGTETRLDERDPVLHPVILSGDLNGDDAPDFGNRADNSNHVLHSGENQFTTTNVRLDGLVVRGGNALAHGNDQGAFRGGGLHARGNIELVRCTFTDNHADSFGGGVSWLGNSLSVSHCRFVGNRTNWQGAGMYTRSAGPVRISDSVFAGNVATQNGTGGLALTTSASGSEREVRNCVVYANRGSFAGGISDPSVFWGSTVIANTVVWGNAAGTSMDQDAQIYLHDEGVVDYSCVQGLIGFPGTGTIGLDPRFVDPVGADGIAGTLDDDLRLAAGSPCIDAGSNEGAGIDFADVDGDGDTLEPVPLDLAGEARFEDDPNTPDTGEGTAPLVDMGPFERAP